MQTAAAPEVIRKPNPTIGRAALVIGGAALLIGALPYILGYILAPKGSRFIGQIFVIDDYAVYLSWTRQAIDGHFFARNLFTSDPQHGIEFNVFFLLLGRIAHACGASPDTALQCARFIAAAALFAIVYRFYRYCLPQHPKAVIASYFLALFGAGLGWIHLLKERDIRLIYPSADSAQPEAFTFLSAYFAPLMAASTVLICGSMWFLLIATESGLKRYAAAAGILLLILGNIHTYDIIHVAFAWIVYLIARSCLMKQIDLRGVCLSALSGIIALPSALYQYYVLRHELVFYERAMESSTRTAEPTFYIFGYGLLLLLAVAGVRMAIRRPDAGSNYIATDVRLRPPILLCMCWAVAGLVLIYAANVPFQRKLIMGEDIPLCLLAGVGAVSLTDRLAPKMRPFGLAVLLLSTVPSTLIFIARDIDTVRNSPRLRGSTGSPYMTETERETFAWIKTRTHPSDVVAAPIRMALFIPGATDRAVWAAHWSETPKCAEKVRKFSDAFAIGGNDNFRKALLRQSHAAYLCYPNNPTHPSLGEMSPSEINRRYVDLADAPPAYLRPRYRNAEYTVYLVDIK